MLLRKSRKVYIHIDCDSFFASCEVLKNPALRGKYVCVGSEIIVACTYNCKALGIKTGTPIWEARRILKNHGVFLPGDHIYYEQISDQLFEFLGDKVLSLELFSIDEAFCEITGLPEMYKLSLGKYLKNLQDEVMREIGIPVSIGCAETKIKAKIYSKLNKPYGLYIGFDEKREIELFKKLDISKIPFIGKSSQRKLQYDAKTIYDFVGLGFWKLKDIFGKTATDLRLELAGVNAFVVKKSPDIKSMSRSRSFNHSMSSDRNFLLLQLHEHFERLFENLTEKNFETKKVALLLRTKSFQTLIFEGNLQEHTNNRSFILSCLVSLFDTNHNKDIVYRSVGVIFSSLRNYLPQQKNIFDKPLRGKENNYKLYKAIENMNSRYGNHKVSFGTSILGIGGSAKLGIRK